jgi:YcxB-like protein
MIPYTGQLTADDYLAANRLHMQKRGWRRVVSVVFWVLLGVGALLSADVAIQDPASGLPPLLLILLIAIVQLVVRLIYLPRRVRRVYSQQRNLQLPFESAVSDAGIEWQNANGKVQIPWSHLIRWKESAAMFVVYQSDIVFNMIPKRCLAQPEDVEALRNTLTERLGPPA